MHYVMFNLWESEMTSFKSPWHECNIQHTEGVRIHREDSFKLGNSFYHESNNHRR